ncbi:uncharacterized protein LOC122319454 [Drosophila yakuba]|uniref:uncharacterized protein LOC122319454 n=1 Tax=Drosophila yakuba TaxID=7245 RepID=UPI001C8A6900|nr:uncharacterized protein LOC122319454 [Drosophila yakuba]
MYGSPASPSDDSIATSSTCRPLDGNLAGARTWSQEHRDSRCRTSETLRATPSSLTLRLETLLLSRISTGADIPLREYFACSWRFGWRRPRILSLWPGLGICARRLLASSCSCMLVTTTGVALHRLLLHRLHGCCRLLQRLDHLVDHRHHLEEALANLLLRLTLSDIAALCVSYV